MVATLVPVAFGIFGLFYGVSALVLGLAFTALAVSLWRQTTRPHAVKLFHFSMIYLALLFVAMALTLSSDGRAVAAVAGTAASHPPDLMHDAVRAEPRALAEKCSPSHSG